MRMDIDSRLVSAVKTSKDEMVLTFQVVNPSIKYTVGEKYTLAEALFEMTSGRRARSGAASQPGAAKKAERRGRPTNKERIRKYIAAHGGTAEHAAKVLHIKQ